jgi:hypothetical protein
MTKLKLSKPGGDLVDVRKSAAADEDILVGTDFDGFVLSRHGGDGIVYVSVVMYEGQTSAALMSGSRTRVAC